MTESVKLLHKLFDEQWEAWMRFDPIFASSTGDHRYDDQLPIVTESAMQSWHDLLVQFRCKCTQLDHIALPEAEQLNLDLFKRFLDDEIAEMQFHAYRMPISKVGGFHLILPDLYQLTPFNNEQDYENYLARLQAIPNFIQANIEIMREGIQTGYIPSRVTLEGIAESMELLFTGDPAQSSFLTPFQSLPESFKDVDRNRLTKNARAIVEMNVLPAFRILQQFIIRDYLPVARFGISAAELPNGIKFYLHRIHYFTSLNLTSEAIHQTGLDEVRRIKAEMQLAIDKSGFSGDFTAFIEFLRTDRRFYTNSPAELLKEVSYVLKRIDGELPRLFKTLPRLPYGIRPIPDFAAPGNTTAYYQPGTGDGTRAGIYYVNTYDLNSRAIYEIEALSLHEAVPGHHLQIALQQELGELPNFRRFASFTSFIEGWALYAERLGLEVGFYTDPYSDFGRLSYEMWRACRLVVDTGIHALGWSRQQAIDFMVANTSLTMLNITNEVDRYIGWPGQALAYKIGELKIRALRAQAETCLRAHFDRRLFHDVVLGSGAVPLDVLENQVQTWINQQLG